MSNITDNPESGSLLLLMRAHQLTYCLIDIAGANGAGWNSVLVHTGVYEPGNGPPTHCPTFEATDVEEAVTWAIDNELKRRRTLDQA